MAWMRASSRRRGNSKASDSGRRMMWYIPATIRVTKYGNPLNTGRETGVGEVCVLTGMLLFEITVGCMHQEPEIEKPPIEAAFRGDLGSDY